MLGFREIKEEKSFKLMMIFTNRSWERCEMR